MLFQNWLDTICHGYRMSRTRQQARRLLFRRKARWSAAAECLESRTLLSAAPVVEVFALVEDTGTPADNITANPSLTGTMSFSNGSVTGMDIDIDYDEDGVVDDFGFTDASGDFTINPATDIGYGEVTVNVRGIGWDDALQDFVTGAWEPLTFTFQHDPPVIASFSLSEDTGVPGDNVTTNPELTGTVTYGNGPVSGINIDVDYDEDGVLDDFAYTDSSGNFTINPASGIGYGEVTVNVRGIGWDNYMEDWVNGDWMPLTFTYEAPSNDPPEVSSFSLDNDTDVPGDNVTTDATLTGTVTNSDGSVDGLDIEIDYDGDGMADDFTVTDASGSFTIDPTPFIGFGEVTVSIQASEWDDVLEEYVIGDPVSLTFTYEAPPNDPPQVASFSLLNDTGTAGDNVTTDPTLTGTVTNSDGPVFGVDIEIDYDGDGIADDFTLTDASGDFTFDPSGFISYGEVTVNVRAFEWDENVQDYVIGDWVELTFTFEEL